MNAFLVVAAVLLSVTLLVNLARTDPKRRRVFGLEPHEGPRRTKTMLAVLILPGVLLLFLGNGAGFTIWLGALTVLGWGVAALDPVRSQAILSGSRHLVTRWSDRMRTGAQTLTRAWRARRENADRIARLEARVQELEDQIRRLDTSSPQAALHRPAGTERLRNVGG